MEAIRDTGVRNFNEEKKIIIIITNGQIFFFSLSLSEKKTYF